MAGEVLPGSDCGPPDRLSFGFDLFLLGDPRTGWLPTVETQEKFAALLQEIGHTRPALIYHYGLQYARIDGKGRFIVGDERRGWAPPESEMQHLREEIAKVMPDFPFEVVRVPGKDERAVRRYLDRAERVEKCVRGIQRKYPEFRDRRSAGFSLRDVVRTVLTEMESMGYELNP